MFSSFLGGNSLVNHRSKSNETIFLELSSPAGAPGSRGPPFHLDMESKSPPADGMQNRLASTLRMRSNFSLRQPSMEFEPSNLDHTFPTGIANAIAADFDAQVRQVRYKVTRIVFPHKSTHAEHEDERYTARKRSTKTTGTSTRPWSRSYTLALRPPKARALYPLLPSGT